jgi:hypothetical protein
MQCCGPRRILDRIRTRPLKKPDPDLTPEKIRIRIVRYGKFL